MTMLQCGFAILAAFRLVDLFMSDRVSVPLRKAWPSYLWTCARCLSVWGGVLATLSFVYCPWLNWPLAISWLYLAVNDRQAAIASRKITITLPRNAPMRIDSAKDISPVEAQVALTAATVAIAKSMVEPYGTAAAR